LCSFLVRIPYATETEPRLRVIETIFLASYIGISLLLLWLLKFTLGLGITRFIVALNVVEASLLFLISTSIFARNAHRGSTVFGIGIAELALVFLYRHPYYSLTLTLLATNLAFMFLTRYFRKR
jgi:hypothetical protein